MSEMLPHIFHASIGDCLHCDRVLQNMGVSFVRRNSCGLRVLLHNAPKLHAGNIENRVSRV